MISTFQSILVGFLCVCTCPEFRAPFAFREESFRRFLWIQKLWENVSVPEDNFQPGICVPVRCLEFFLSDKILSLKYKDIWIHKWTSFSFFLKSELQMEHYILFPITNSCFICLCFHYTKAFTTSRTVKL